MSSHTLAKSHMQLLSELDRRETELKGLLLLFTPQETAKLQAALRAMTIESRSPLEPSTIWLVGRLADYAMTSLVCQIAKETRERADAREGEKHNE